MFKCQEKLSAFREFLVGHHKKDVLEYMPLDFGIIAKILSEREVWCESTAVQSDERF